MKLLKICIPSLCFQGNITDIDSLQVLHQEKYDVARSHLAFSFAQRFAHKLETSREYIPRPLFLEAMSLPHKHFILFLWSVFFSSSKITSIFQKTLQGDPEVRYLKPISKILEIPKKLIRRCMTAKPFTSFSITQKTKLAANFFEQVKDL